MLSDESPNLYDLLEVAPDATPQEIRAAYTRAKSAYKKDSVALYSLMSAEETEQVLARLGAPTRARVACLLGGQRIYSM